MNTADDVIYPVVPTYAAGSQQVTLTIAAGGTLPVGGLYQLTIRSAALASLHDVSGIPLDGDANGTPGGNFVYPFTVGAPTPVTLSGAAEYLRLDADGVHLDVWANATGTGPPARQVVLSQASAIVVVGTAGNDSLTVDFSAGNPIPAGGLSFDGAAGVNALHVVGTPGADAVTVGTSTVTVNAAVLSFANTQSITVDGDGGTDTVTQAAQPGGGAVLSLVNPTAAETLTVNAGTYTFAAPAAGSGVTPLSLGLVNVGAGATVAVASAASPADRYVLTLGGLTLAGSFGNWKGRLDVGDNDLIVRGGNLTTITDQVRGGLTGSGNGIASSAAAADPRQVTTLGAILNTAGGGGTPLYGSGTALGLFDGQNPSAADVLVKYTYYGDANLDGTVNGIDYARLDGGANQGLTGWFNGDDNYDGHVDGSDYTLADNAFNVQGKAATGTTLTATTGTTTIAAGPAGGGVTRVTVAGVTIAAGAKVVVAAPATPADRTLVVTNALTLAGTAGAWQSQLDLTGNDLIVRGGSLSSVTNEVASGFAGGTWTGLGITSSAAAADPAHLHALGVVANDDGAGNRLYGSGTTLGLFDGYDPARGDVLVRYTLYGDANLDGVVDGADYARIDAGYNGHLTGWFNGDFNGDGTVDGSDYTLIDNAFNLQPKTAALTTLSATTGTTTIAAGPAGGGVTRIAFAGVTIAAGAKVVVSSPAAAADRALVVTNALTLAGSAGAWQSQLDLTGNDLLVHGGSLSQVTNQVASGFAAGTWGGLGVTSSSAAADPTHLHALGVVANDDGTGNRLYGSGTTLGLFDGYDPARGDVLVRYTLYGDANLDGVVDGADYARIDAGYNGHLTGWFNGDFNGDGTVDGSDYTLVDNAFNKQPGVSGFAAAAAAETAAAAAARAYSPFAVSGAITDREWKTSAAAEVIVAASRKRPPRAFA